MCELRAIAGLQDIVVQDDDLIAEVDFSSLNGRTGHWRTLDRPLSFLDLRRGIVAYCDADIQTALDMLRGAVGEAAYIRHWFSTLRIPYRDLRTCLNPGLNLVLSIGLF